MSKTNPTFRSDSAPQVKTYNNLDELMSGVSLMYVSGDSQGLDNSKLQLEICTVSIRISNTEMVLLFHFLHFQSMRSAVLINFPLKVQLAFNTPDSHNHKLISTKLQNLGLILFFLSRTTAAPPESNMLGFTEKRIMTSGQKQQ